MTGIHHFIHPECWDTARVGRGESQTRLFFLKGGTGWKLDSRCHARSEDVCMAELG